MDVHQTFNLWHYNSTYCKNQPAQLNRFIVQCYEELLNHHICYWAKCKSAIYKALPQLLGACPWEKRESNQSSNQQTPTGVSQWGCIWGKNSDSPILLTLWSYSSWHRSVSLHCPCGPIPSGTDQFCLPLIFHNGRQIPKPRNMDRTKSIPSGLLSCPIVKS